MERRTSRNRVQNGIRTRFLDQISLSAFRPADLLGIEIANYLTLDKTFYGDSETQFGNGEIVDSLGRIDGTSQVIFRNVNLAAVPSAVNGGAVTDRVDVYINGLFLEKTAIVDGYPQDQGSDLLLVIDNTKASLENNLDENDLLTISGKLVSTS